MKKILLALAFVVSLFGAEAATREDIKEIKELILTTKSDIQREMDKRFEAVDKRFEAVDKRFDDMDKRFAMVQQQIQASNEYISSLVNGLFGVIAGIFGLIGFMMWDRRTVVEKAKKETEQSVEKIIETRLEKKADKALLDKILEIIERLAKDDKETQEMLKKHRMSFA